MTSTKSDDVLKLLRSMSTIMVVLICLPSFQPDGTAVASAWTGNYKHRTDARQQQPRKQHKVRRALCVCDSSRLPTMLGVSVSDKDNSIKGGGNYLTSLLQNNGYGSRIFELSLGALPVLAEMYDHGRWELCLVTGFQTSSSNNEWTAPRIKVRLASNSQDERVVDIGQLTTIWDTCLRSQLLDSWQTRVDRELDRFPVQHRDRSMQKLYQSCANSPRKISSGGLTKKQINRLVDRSNCDESRRLTENVLRKVVKAGVGMSRLADSLLSMDYLYDDYPTNEDDSLVRRMVGADVLSRDAELGGRFKRMPCAFVSGQLCDSNTTITSVTVVNGGWLAVDESIRAETEARKFVRRAESSAEVDDDTRVQLITAADERIAQRLECLAMGQLFSWETDSGSQSEDKEHTLEIDVREALKAMGLPTNPQGAQQALLKIGRWSKKPNAIRLEPWSKPTLDAARCFADMDRERRQYLRDVVSTMRTAENEGIESRTDLTFLPCVCVDATRATFRDDAIGVRPRSSTGRKVIPDASKYEILVHIADVSDIYSPQPQHTDTASDFRRLREAAESRGASRYDLPLGPLHLMPPVALEALSLNTVKVDMTSKESGNTKIVGGANRCVTMWAYIDERTGKVIDAGVERTLVSNPLALSFADATALLEGNLSDPRILQDQGHPLKKIKAILAVVERNLRLWTIYHRKNDEAARKREMRLSVKELVAKEMKSDRSKRDDGRDGFQRTRGHRLVDAALDLYGYCVTGLLRRAKAPIPRASGSGAKSGARVATAPLRRYIDGVAQRQALSVLCDYGGPPLTRAECSSANKKADEAINALSNIRAVRQGSRNLASNQGRQQQALRLLQAELAGRNRPLPAISTGRENEVTIVGVGAIGKCRGVRGSLAPGKKILVNVRKLDAQKGILSVSLFRDSKSYN